MKINSTLDWLRFTVPIALTIDDILPFDWAIPVKTEKPLTPYPGYNTAMRLEVGRVDWHDMRPEQRKMITLTGDDFLMLRRRDFNVDLLLHHMSKIARLNVTRLDFAVDVYEPGIRANEVYEADQHGGIKSSARSIRRVQTKAGPRDNDPATTVYIGSRSSTAMIRVYDKGKQQRKQIDWVRIEIELKKAKAQKAAELMHKHGIYDAGCQIMRETAMVDVEWWSPALSGHAEIDLTIGRKETDWEKWVRDTVLPNFERAVKTDTAGAREMLRVLATRYTDLLNG